MSVSPSPAPPSPLPSLPLRTRLLVAKEGGPPPQGPRTQDRGRGRQTSSCFPHGGEAEEPGALKRGVKEDRKEGGRDGRSPGGFKLDIGFESPKCPEIGFRGVFTPYWAEGARERPLTKQVGRVLVERTQTPWTRVEPKLGWGSGCSMTAEIKTGRLETDLQV